MPAQERPDGCLLKSFYTSKEELLASVPKSDARNLPRGGVIRIEKCAR